MFILLKKKLSDLIINNAISFEIRAYKFAKSICYKKYGYLFQVISYLLIYKLYIYI